MLFCNGYYLGSVVDTYWDPGMILLYGGRMIEWYPGERSAYDIVCPD